MSTMTYGPARAEDLPALRALLEASDLPLAGVDEALGGFVVARDEKAGIIGCAALERYGHSGLLRSVAVADAWRGHGIAGGLTLWLLDTARGDGLTDITLLTTTAADYFPRYGFHAIPRDQTPAAIRASVEFRDACPDTATVMTRALGS